jgi:hypothetical protein
MDIVHVCIQYSNLQNIAKYWFHVPTMTKFHSFARFISLTLYIRCSWIWLTIIWITKNKMKVHFSFLTMKVKLIVHTRIHCITCSIHNADIYIVYSPFGDSENRGTNLLKIRFNFVFFFLKDISSCILYTKSSKYLQIFWTQNKKVTY